LNLIYSIVFVWNIYFIGAFYPLRGSASGEHCKLAVGSRAEPKLKLNFGTF